MKRAKGIKPGSIVQFPYSCFSPMAKGWNGWIFKIAIVEKLYKSESGHESAKVRYCARLLTEWDKEEIVDYAEARKIISFDNLFEVSESEIEHSSGEDREFLKRHGLL